MFHMQRYRSFAIAFGLALALVLGLFAQRTSAVASVKAYGEAGSDTCFGANVPATYQDAKVGFELGQFDSSEEVFIDITFPDGRIYTLSSAFGPSGNVDQGLDGVIDQPINDWFPNGISPVSGGSTFRSFKVSNDFPYGCYRVAARSATHNAFTTFAVKPRVGPAPFAGQARLRVEDRTTGALVVQHGGAVNIIGQGFRANELVYVWITAPDGAVYDWPDQFNNPDLQKQLTTNNYGEFVASFEFANYNGTGEYKFTAKGSQSGYVVIAPITLVAQPIQTKGFAALRVAYPSNRTGQQRAIFEVQGDRFNPGERVDIWVNFPDNSVRGLPSQFADPYGMFYVELATDEVLPIGEYKFTAKGDQSGAIIITSFVLTQNSTVNADASDPFDPSVVESNTGGGTLGEPVIDPCSTGPIDEQTAAANPGPEVGNTGYSCP